MSLSIQDIINIINNYTNYLFYIGQTDNPQRRLKEHYKQKNVIILIPLYKDNKSVIDAYEQQLIKEFSSNKNNMNLMINNIPKKVNNINNNDNNIKNQYIYIAFKDYKILDILTDDLKNKSLIIYNKLNKNTIITYEELIIKNIDLSNNNDNNKIDKQKKEIIKKEYSEKEYNNILNECINIITRYLNQKTGKYKYFHIGKCKNYKEKKNKLQCKGIESNNIKQIKKCLKNDKLVNQLKYDLCKNYQHKSDIILDNKNGLLSNILKNINNNNIIYIYFY